MALDEPRSVGQILADTLALYRRYPFLFALLAAPVVASRDLVVLAASGAGPLAHGGHGDFATSMLLQLLDFSLIGPLISALHTHAVVLAGEGVTPRLWRVAGRGLRVLPVVMAAEIVANIGIGIAAITIIGGIWLTLRWAVVAQTAAVEHGGWIPSLRRSGQLASGNYWRIAGLLLSLGVPVFAVHLAATSLPLGPSSSAVSVAVGIVIHTLVASVYALAYALLYFDLRSREGTVPASEQIREYPYLRDLD